MLRVQCEGPLQDRELSGGCAGCGPVGLLALWSAGLLVLRSACPGGLVWASWSSQAKPNWHSGKLQPAGERELLTAAAWFCLGVVSDLE